MVTRATQAGGLALNQMSVRRRLRRHPMTRTRTRISEDQSLICNTRVRLNIEEETICSTFFILFSCFSSFGRIGQLYIRGAIYLARS